MARPRAKEAFLLTRSLFGRHGDPITMPARTMLGRMATMPARITLGRVVTMPARIMLDRSA
jgi:hypothetical protein